MATKLDVFNKSLRRIRAKNSIASLNERSNERVQCENAYVSCVRETLSEYDWSFARRIVMGTLLANKSITGYDYGYRYPADCLKLRRIDKDFPQEPWPKYKMFIDDQGERIIYAQKSPAMLVYTAEVLEPTVVAHGR
jgi:hypothetical protein